ncbi:hypothetical protein SAMN02745163_01416 [Clostridium cavendishii DSM 21758]|uniref:Uncharacterized protein n=1 Tax=Clostridium cavendishii DSM 21758 TaxID=1121302 RepID=A0A1M6GX59_9CLOT|nr:hypothetical protein [Clostridium cavendishii]SHJ14512.1 hypothetical protein SAMN02745163_01416 [Clostridium cavendishii DSM 21758]
MVIIPILYVIHIAIFIVLGSMGNPNTGKWLDYSNFGTQSAISIVCLILNIWLLLPSSNCESDFKIVLLIINIIEIVGVITIFLLPMWGEPPTIQF